MSPLVTALRTLTILPVPGRDARNLASSLPFFPVAGALIGALVTLCAKAVAQTGWTEGAGAVAAVAAIWLTRGLHVDGLADVSDALGGGRTLERRLAIMKDPHTGAFGVIAVAADLLLKAVALARLAALSQWALMALPFIVSRTAQVVLAVWLPYARPEGGTAQSFVADARPTHLALTLPMALLWCVLIGQASGVILLLEGLVLAVLVGLWMKRVFGGVTGDLLGAANETVETGLLVFMAAVAGKA